MTQQFLLESSLLLAVISAYEWRLRSITHRVSKTPSMDEVERLVDLKVEVIKYRHDDLREDIREDIHRVEKKVDLLIARELKT